MSKHFTDKYLRAKASLKGRPLTGDISCDSCGYNLRGLRYGQSCPECGAPILWQDRKDIALHEMPVRVIKRFRLSCRLASLSGVVLLATTVAVLFLEISMTVVTLALWASVIIWAIATWGLTSVIEGPQARHAGVGSESKMRRCARWLNLAWLLFALAVAGLAPDPLYGVMLYGGCFGGLAGLLALSLHLARYADWVRDDYASGALNLTVFGAATVVVLMIVVPIILAPIPIVALFARLLLALGLLVSLVAFPIGLFSLSRSMEWSVVHAEDRIDRDRTLAERVQRPRRPATTAPAPRTAVDGVIPLSDLPSGTTDSSDGPGMENS